MGRYLELFKGNFDGTVYSKCKIENWPYVGFSAATREVVFSDTEWDVVIDPEYTDGPANDEVWYTTVDGQPYDTSILFDSMEQEGVEYTGPNILSHTFNAEKEVYVLKFDREVVQWGMTLDPEMEIAFDAFTLFDPDADEPIINQIWLPKTVSTLGYVGYFNTTAKEIRLPEGLKTMIYCSIYGNQQLETLIIPNTIEYISCGSVVANDKLTNIQFLGTIKQWESVVKEDMVNDAGEVIPWIFPGPDVVHCTDGDAPII